MHTTQHTILVPTPGFPYGPVEYAISVEWQQIKCECTSECGNQSVTERWVEFQAETITLHKTGDSVYTDEIDEDSPNWSRIALNDILNGDICH